MPSRRSHATTPSADSPPAEAIPAGGGSADLPEWVHRVAEQGVRPEQALAFIGLGLMRRMARHGDGVGEGWIWDEAEVEGSVDLAVLRQRLELTRLAIDTGAPLSTAEVAQLLGARPGGGVVERGGLTARRLGRNVWRLSRSSDDPGRAGYGFAEGFRRRL
jgi:hypothetical protein